MHRLKEVIARGRDRLIQKFPLLVQACNLVTQAQAESFGISLEELKEVALLNSIDTLAGESGEDLVSFLIRNGSESDDEVRALITDWRDLRASGWSFMAPAMFAIEQPERRRIS